MPYVLSECSCVRERLKTFIDVVQVASGDVENRIIKCIRLPITALPGATRKNKVVYRLRSNYVHVMSLIDGGSPQQTLSSLAILLVRPNMIE